MKGTTYPSWIELSRANLLHNVRSIRALADPHASLFAVVKANAYGHGIFEVSSLIRPYVDGYCVANTDEAIQLRSTIRGKRILAMSYFTTLKKDHLRKCASKAIEVVASGREVLHILARSGIALSIHVKIDSGTGRIGFQDSDIPYIISTVNKSKLRVRGIFSHFSDVENMASTYWLSQLRSFDAMYNKLISGLHTRSADRHIACSAAISRSKRTHGTLVRTGIHLYGLSGFSKIQDAHLDLRPVLSWKTSVIHIKKVPPGSFIGYNKTYKTTSPTTIVTVPLGYADGLDRHLSNTGRMLVGGAFAPIRGNVCMNLTMLETKKGKKIKLGDEVVCIGHQKNKKIEAYELAKQAGTINYEIVTRIPEQLPRIVV